MDECERPQDENDISIADDETQCVPHVAQFDLVGAYYRRLRRQMLTTQVVTLIAALLSLATSVLCLVALWRGQ